MCLLIILIVNHCLSVFCCWICTFMFVTFTPFFFYSYNKWNKLMFCTLLSWVLLLIFCSVLLSNLIILKFDKWGIHFCLCPTFVRMVWCVCVCVWLALFFYPAEGILVLCVCDIASVCLRSPAVDNFCHSILSDTYIISHFL